MPRVICIPAEYESDLLKAQIFSLMDSFGGRDLIGKGSRVLVKPNLLGPASPEKAMLTHPSVVRIVVEYVLEQGGLPVVSDSPAMGSFDRVLKESGLKKALRGLDVECREFKASRTIDVGEPFGRLEISEDALDADVLLNLPKLKTHSQMLLTLGVKNLFGCIVGLRKPEWHLRAGVDREMFATLLARICQAVGPSLTILDGVLGMEGEGPGKGGVPRRIGVMMGSDNPVAVDIAVCRMLGIDPDDLLTTRAARRLGMIDGPVDVEGALPVIAGFDLPGITPVVFGPKWTHKLSRKHLIQRPSAPGARCRSCGECWRYCPAGAISHSGKDLVFDYDKCIRCYCCLEVCPHGVLKTEEPLLGRALRKIVRRFS